MTEPAASAPPQLSPDGKWWWDGLQWVPAPAAPPPPPPVAAEPAHSQLQVPHQPSGAQPAAHHVTPAAVAQPSLAPVQRTFVPAFAPAPEPPGKMLAIISLVASLVWMLGVGSLAAVVLGHLSRSQDRKAGASPSGLALAGLVLGYVGLVFSLPVMAALAIPTFLAQKDSAQTAVISSELRSAAVAQEEWSVQAGTYTTSLSDLAMAGYAPSSSVRLEVVSADASGYCLRASVQDRDPLYLGSGDLRVGSTPCG